MNLKYGTLAFGLILSGCAQFPPKTTYQAESNPAQVLDYDEGWRLAELRQIGPTQAIAHAQQWDCRSPTSSTAPDQPYALVRFKRAQLAIDRVVPIRQTDALKPGQQVIVNIRTCQLPALYATPH